MAEDLTQEQVRVMDEDQAKALVEIRKVLSLNPKISIAWVTLMDRTDGWRLAGPNQGLWYRHETTPCELLGCG